MNKWQILSQLGYTVDSSSTAHGDGDYICIAPDGTKFLHNNFGNATELAWLHWLKSLPDFLVLRDNLNNAIAELASAQARIAELEAQHEKRNLALRYIFNEISDLANNPPLSSDTMAGELGRAVDRLRTVIEVKPVNHCQTCDGRGIARVPFSGEGYSPSYAICSNCGGTGIVNESTSSKPLPVDPLAEFFANTPKAPAEPKFKVGDRVRYAKSEWIVKVSEYRKKVGMWHYNLEAMIGDGWALCYEDGIDLAE